MTAYGERIAVIEYDIKYIKKILYGIVSLNFINLGLGYAPELLPLLAAFFLG